MRANGAKILPQTRRARLDHLRIGPERPHPPQGGGGGVRDQRAGRRLPHRDVDRGIADIVEAALPERIAQRRGLGPAREIADPVGCEDAVEASELVGDRLYPTAIGGGSEIQTPAPRTLL